MNRPRHPRKDLEALLREAEGNGWRVTKGKYYIMWCPCALKHKRTVHLTPSDPGYVRNLLGWLRRETCWHRDHEGER